MSLLSAETEIRFFTAFTSVSIFLSDLRQTGCHLSDLDDAATEKALPLLANGGFEEKNKYK